MKYVAVLDVSSFIWDAKDYEVNEAEYYGMMDSMLSLQDKLITFKSYVLLRFELYNQIMVEFPYSITTSKFSDFTYRTLKFFSDLGERMEVYDSATFNITTVPSLLKQHFSAETSTEVQYLINRIHTQPNPDVVFFSYQYLWTGGKLKTRNGDDELEFETIIGEQIDQVEKFFTRYKPTFEHSDKHDKYNSGEYVSGLSCYNERNGDNKKAQELLDKAKQSGSNYYNFDLENNVWVVFRATRNNIYHGHDETDSNNIPTDVRRHFSK